MHNARFRLMAAMAGATMCLFAANANGQNTNTTTGTTTADPNAAASTQAPTTLSAQPGTNAPATTGTVDNAAPSQTFDNTTPTTTTVETRRGFPWGVLGLLGLLGLMKRGTTEVRRDTYTAGARPVGTATADDRMNLTPRAASGTGTGPGTTGTSGTSGSSTGSMGDPNARR